MSIKLKAALAVLFAQTDVQESLMKVIRFIKNGDSDDKTAMHILDMDLEAGIEALQNLRRVLQDDEKPTSNEDNPLEPSQHIHNPTGNAGDELFFRIPNDHTKQLWILDDPEYGGPVPNLRSCTTGTKRGCERSLLTKAQELTPNDPVEYISADGKEGFFATVIRQEQDSNKVSVKINEPGQDSIYRVQQEVEVSEDNLTFYDRYSYENMAKKHHSEK